MATRPRRSPPEDYSLIFAEMREGNDRATILVGVSLLEHGLQRAIRTSLRPSAGDKEEQDLFGDNGIAGTLSQATNLAYFLGIIGPQTRRDIDLLRKIRNDAAHNVNQVTFGTEPIRSWMGELKILDKPIADSRMKFTTTITLLSSGLLVTAGHNCNEEENLEVEKQASELEHGETLKYVSGPRPGLPNKGGNLIVLLRK